MTAEEAQVVENEEVEEIQLYNIPVLQMLKSAQQEHGLRHRDYQRYRRYCNNRCRRIRKFLKFRQGEKKRVGPRKVTEYEAKQNALFVHLCIMGIEQDWAYSMELKHDDGPRSRHHMRNKLRKASRKASELTALLESIADQCDSRTTLEVEAYCAFITASWAFEQQDWPVCFAKFKSTQTIYNSLAGTLAADEAEIYSKASQEIEPSLRYCQYNLNESSDGASMQDFIGKGNQLIDGKVSEHLAKLKIEESENLNVTEWRGRKIAVKNESVRVFLLNYRQFMDNIVDIAADELQEKYVEMLMEAGEAIDAVKGELRLDPTHRTVIEKGQTPQNDLYLYLHHIKLEITLGRYGIIAANAEKMNEMSRVYEQTVQYLSEFIKKCYEADNSELGDELDSEKNSYLAACRYYQSQQAHETGKLKEAGALILKARQLLEKSEPKRETTKTLHSTISSQVQSSSSSIQAALVLPATQSIKKDSTFDKENVLKNLGDFGAQFGTFEFPPALKPIPAKATLFDIAGDKVFAFPNLEDKVEKKQAAGDSKGITGRLGGWLGWGAK